MRGGRSGPQGDRHGCRSLFVRAGGPVEKPGRPSRTCRAISPASAKRGALSFGYFSLSKQRKVTRRSADRRKPAAGEPGRGKVNKSESHWSPAFAGMTVREIQRYREHQLFTPFLGLTPNPLSHGARFGPLKEERERSDVHIESQTLAIDTCPATQPNIGCPDSFNNPRPTNQTRAFSASCSNHARVEPSRYEYPQASISAISRALPTPGNASDNTICR